MFKSVFRNLFCDSFFWCVLILLLGINIYSICDIAGKRNDEISGHETIYKEFKGELTKEKIQKAVDRYKKLSQIISEDNYSREGNQPGTYTGYYAGDYGEFEEIFKEYKYRYEYSSYAKKIAAKPMASSRIKKAMEGRELTSYYDMEGPQEWLEYDLYTLLCVALTIFFACKMIVYDRKQKIYILLETCSLGMRRVTARKIGALIVYIFLAVSFFSIVNGIVFWKHYDMEGISQPLYAIEEYKNTLFTGSVFQYWLVQTLGVCVGCAFIGIACMFFSIVIKEELYALLLGFFVYIGFVVLFFKTTFLGNPVGLLAGTNLIKHMDLYWETLAAVLALDFLCGGILIWISGLYRVSVHS